MQLILSRTWTVSVGATGSTTTISPGTHEVERVDNPYGIDNSNWLVLSGTLTGASEAFWRQWSGPKWKEFEVKIVE